MFAPATVTPRQHRGGNYIDHISCARLRRARFGILV
jgi:hypothetical protein